MDLKIWLRKRRSKRGLFILECDESLKIPKLSINEGQTNLMTKRKMAEQTLIYKTLHRKLKIEQHGKVKKYKKP